MAGKLSIRLLDSVKMRVGGVFDEPCAMGETSHVVHDQTTQMELAQLKSVMLQAIDHGAETLGMSTDQVKAHDISDWQRLQAEVAEKRRRRDALRERVTAKLEAAIRERLQSNVAAQTTTVEDSTSEGPPCPDLVPLADGVEELCSKVSDAISRASGRLQEVSSSLDQGDFVVAAGTS